MSLARDRKILHKLDFEALFSKGHKFRASGLVAYARRIEHANPTRLGVIVSKKYFKHATQRNYLKRFIREYFRSYPFVGCGEVVVVVYNNFAALDTAAKKLGITELWQKIDQFWLAA